MKWIMSSVAVLVAAVLWVGVAAQSNGTVGKGDKMNKMEMPPRITWAKTR